MAGPSIADVERALAAYLQSVHLPPTSAWIRSFVPTVRLQTPMVALQKTALFRLLSTDITTSVQPFPANFFPPGVSSPEVRERRLAGPIAVQVLDVEDIGHSRWSQVEEIEAQERGERTRGREVVRVVQDGDETDPGPAQAPPSTSAGPHKILLQDAKGAQVYGLETVTVPGIGVQMAMGSKLVLKDVVVARGVVLLDPRCVELLGGKVEVWEKKWRAERKELLKRNAGMSGEGT